MNSLSFKRRLTRIPLANLQVKVDQLIPLSKIKEDHQIYPRKSLLTKEDRSARDGGV
jgi:hypothetical protein